MAAGRGALTLVSRGGRSVQRRRSRSCGGSAHHLVGKKSERRERQEQGRFFSFKLCVPGGKSFFYLLEVAMKKRCHPPVFSCDLSVPGRSDVQSDPAVQRLERLLRVHRSIENASEDRAGERTPLCGVCLLRLEYGHPLRGVPATLLLSYLILIVYFQTLLDLEVLRRRHPSAVPACCWWSCGRPIHSFSDCR